MCQFTTTLSAQGKQAEQPEWPSDRYKQILYKPIRKLTGYILNICHYPVSLPVADEAAASLIITLAAHTFGKLQTNHKDDDYDSNPEMSSLDFNKHFKICCLTVDALPVWFLAQLSFIILANFRSWDLIFFLKWCFVIYYFHSAIINDFIGILSNHLNSEILDIRL